MFSLRLAIVSFMLLSLSLMTLDAQGGNLALGKRYTLTAEPNWHNGSYTPNHRAWRQLTDGRCETWGDVGWRHRNPIEVVLDLGVVQPIDAVSVDGGWVSSASYWPDIVLAVSDNGKDYHVVARGNHSAVAVSESPTRSEFRYADLKTRGRYVLLRLNLKGPEAYLNEITVDAGTHEASSVVFPKDGIQPLPIQREWTQSQQQWLGILNNLVERMEENREPLPSARQVYALREWVEAAPTRQEGKVRVMDPDINDLLGRKVEELRRTVYRELFPLPKDSAGAKTTGTSLVIRQIPPYIDFVPGAIPPAKDSVRRPGHLVAGQGEYVSASWMISNPGDTDRSVRVNWRDFASGSGPWAGTAKVRHAYIKTYPSEGVVLADALPLLDHELVIPAWQSRQVWLEFDTGPTAAGSYRGTLNVESGAGFTQELELALEVLPVRFPHEAIPFSAFVWEGAYASAVSDLRADVVADQLAHRITVDLPVLRVGAGPEGIVPLPKDGVDKDGNIIAKLDFGKLDEYLTQTKPIWSQRGCYFYMYMEHLVAGLEPGTPYYTTCKQHIPLIADHLKERWGLTSKDYAWYPVDEQIGSNFIRAARFIRETLPEARIFANPMGGDSVEHLRQASPYVDVWCPGTVILERPWLLDAFQQDAQTRGKALVCYTVGRRSVLAYETYRLPPCRAWRMGATGAGFWCYSGGPYKADNYWDESAFYYAAIYTLKGAPTDISRAERIIPSKRWEAWRAGIQDYTWLYLLRERMEICRKAPDLADRVSLAQRVLKEAVESVLGSAEGLTDEQGRPIQTNAQDSAEPVQVELADLHRENVLRALAKLGESTP